MNSASVDGLQQWFDGSLPSTSLSRCQTRVNTEFKESLQRLAGFESIKIKRPKTNWLDGWKVVGKDFEFASQTWDLGLVAKTKRSSDFVWPRYVYAYKGGGGFSTLMKTTIFLPDDNSVVGRLPIQDWETYVTDYDDSTLRSGFSLLSSSQQFYKEIKRYYQEGLGHYCPGKNFQFLDETSPDAVLEFNSAANTTMFITQGPICLLKNFGHTCLSFGRCGFIEKTRLPALWDKTSASEDDLKMLIANARIVSLLEDKTVFEKLI